MALQVPTFGSQVQADAAPTIRVDESSNLSDFGGGQAVSDAMGAAAKTADEGASFYNAQKKAADDTRGQDVYSKATQLKNKLLYDPQSGAMSKKGAAALNVTNDYMKQYQDQMNDIASGLDNDVQREQFNKINRVVSDELNTSLTKHVYGETQDLQKQVYQTTLDTSHDDTADNYQNAGKVDSSLKFQENVIRDQAQKLGIPTFIADKQVADNRSTQLAAVLKRAIDNEDPNLEAMKAQYLPLITNEKVVESLDKPLAEASMRRSSQQTSDSIMQQTSDPSKRLQLARAIEDPKLRDETVKRIVDDNTQNEQAVKQGQAQNYDTVTQLLYNNGGDISKVPINLLNGLSGEQHDAAGKLANQVKSGFPPQKNGQRFYDLKQIAAADPEKYSKLDLSLERPNMQDDELRSLIDLQAQVVGKATDDGTLRGLRTRNQVVNQSLAKAGIKDKGDIQDFNVAVDNQIATEFSDGKKPNGQDVQRIVDNLLVSTKAKGQGWIFGDGWSKPAFKQAPGSDLITDYKGIPSATRKQIEATLKSNGIQVTNDKVLDMYNRYVTGNANAQ